MSSDHADLLQFNRPSFEASLRCVGAPSGSRRAARRLTAALNTFRHVLPPRKSYNFGPLMSRAILRRLNHPDMVGRYRLTLV